MKRVQMITLLMIAGLFITACNSPVNHSTKTYVKELAENDVFETLSEDSSEVLVYENEKEIEGEYLVLATLNIHQENGDDSLTEVVQDLKNETMLLGGNGILILEKSMKKNESGFIKDMKAIAVYTLDKKEAGKELAAL
jgi:hypothetical protein